MKNAIVKIINKNREHFYIYIPLIIYMPIYLTPKRILTSYL